MAKKKQTSAEASAGRAKEASERARARLSAQTGNTDDVDITRVPLSWWRERWSDKAIRRSFIENFIYVRDAFDENKLVPMKFNDFQADLHEKVIGRDAIVKFRRGGSSSYWKAVYFADAIVIEGCNVRVVPQDPDTEEGFRADLKTMYENLPDHLRPGIRQWTDRLIWFTNDSRIVTATVQPGHEQKGRGQTITRLFLTEVPFWRGNQRKAATALIEATAGGQVAVESTPFGIEWFHSIYQDGKTGKGGWTSHFYHWWWKRDYQIEGATIIKIDSKYFLINPLHPEPEKHRAAISRDELKICARILVHLLKLGYVPARTKWHSPQIAAYLAWRRAKIEELPGGAQQFQVEYPENDQDCFEQTGRPVVKAEYLKVTCEPGEAVEGREYAIGCDTSLGLESGDPAAIEIIEVHTGRQVYEETLKRQPDLLADRLAELSDLYNGALLVVERNGPGIATVRKLLELGYDERVYRHIDARLRRSIEDGRLTMDEAMEQAQHGFPTSTETKPLMALELERGLRTGALGLSSQEFCDEAKTVVWFDNGSYGALAGYHDDRFMALAIVWLVVRTTMGMFTGFVGAMPEAGYAR